ncbi:MAG: tRNA pseudouridine(38-40) synthase TruA [Bacillota bacterium]
MKPDLKTCLMNKQWGQLKGHFHPSIALRLPSGDIVRGEAAVLEALTSFPWTQCLDYQVYENLHIGVFEKNLHVKIKFRDALVNRIYLAEVDPSIQRIRLDCAYDGTLYHGFQRQKGKPTIQGSLESVLRHITQETLTITPSGRTDRGVHARHQVIHFDTQSTLEPEHMKRLMNRMLPDDISVFKAEYAPKVFHARFDAYQKTYHYTIANDRDPFMAHYAWFKEGIDITKLNAKLSVYQGEHDFAAFGKKSEKAHSRRTIRFIEAVESDGLITVVVKAEGFLRHMVRTMVGTAVRDIEKNTHEVERALSKPDEGHVFLAPASGLSLHEVTYGR